VGLRLKARIFVADAHRGDEKRFIVRADEKLRAFLNEACREAPPSRYLWLEQSRGAPAHKAMSIKASYA